MLAKGLEFLDHFRDVTFASRVPRGTGTKAADARIAAPTLAIQSL
jgi:hypothetical protein